MAYKKKNYGSGSIGTSLQGKIIHVRRGPAKGKALCTECKSFKFGYYCEKYKGSAHYPNKRKKCNFYEQLKEG